MFDILTDKEIIQRLIYYPLTNQIGQIWVRFFIFIGLVLVLIAYHELYRFPLNTTALFVLVTEDLKQIVIGLAFA